MRAIESIIAEHRASAKPLRVAALGGVEAIVADQAHLCASPFAAELVGLLLREGTLSDAAADTPAASFVIACYSGATDPLTLLELGDLLEPLARASKAVSDAVFSALIATFESKGSKELRRVALRAALSSALGVRSRELRLAATLLDVEFEGADAPAMAKAMGLVWSRVREDGLVQRLNALEAENCSAASYELGCLKLVMALEGAPSGHFAAELRDAEAAFQRACDSSEVATEAHLMRLSIEALQALIARSGPAPIETISAELERQAFALQAAQRSETPMGWQLAEREHIACWARMALTMDALAKRLWEPSWWEPAAVIGEQLLRVYGASQSFFRKGAPVGLEAIVKPVIETSVFNSAAKLHLIREWLRHNPYSPQSANASELIVRVEQMGEAALPMPAQEPAPSGSVEQNAETIGRLMSGLSIEFDASLPDALRVTLQDWLEQIEAHADLRDNGGARQFVGQIVYFLLRFLHACTDRASPSDPLSSYLFERSAENLPLENALQNHFLAMLSGWMGSIGYEVRGVAGGRCDVLFSRGAERFVVEVKRELKAASPAALFVAYGAQTEEYQNSSWRLGILLVLDLTREDGKGLHMKDAVASRTLQRNGESAARTIFLTRIAGRRLTPSNLTKSASGTKPAGSQR